MGLLVLKYIKVCGCARPRRTQHYGQQITAGNIRATDQSCAFSCAN